MSGLFGYVNLHSDQSESPSRESLVSLFKRKPEHKEIYVEFDYGIVGWVGVDALYRREPLYQDDDGSFCLIYGYLTFREDLESRFGLPRAKSDAETLFNAFCKLGSKALECIEGSFNIVFFSCSEREFFVANDFFGTRALCYQVIDNGLCFGPQMKIARMMGNQLLDIDYEAVFDFLGFGNYFGDKTFIKNIKYLPHASKIEEQLNEIKVERYDDIYYQTTQMTDLRFSAWSDEIHEAYLRGTESVRQFEENVALELSGGSDSRILASYFSKHGHDFTPWCILSDGAMNDDYHISKKVCSSLGLEPRILNYGYRNKSEADAFEEAMACYDGTIPFSLAVAAADFEPVKEASSVLVHGLNGNQMFGDYFTQFEQRRIHFFRERSISVEDWNDSGGDGLYEKLTFELFWKGNDVFSLLNDDARTIGMKSTRDSFLSSYHRRTDLFGAIKYEYLIMTEICRRNAVVGNYLSDHFLQVNPFYDNRSFIDLYTRLPHDMKYMRFADYENARVRFPESRMIPRVGGGSHFINWRRKPHRFNYDFYSSDSLYKGAHQKVFQKYLNSDSLLLKKLDIFDENCFMTLVHRLKEGHEIDGNTILRMRAIEYFLRNIVS